MCIYVNQTTKKLENKAKESKTLKSISDLEQWVG
jgi:hypothetical protein